MAQLVVTLSIVGTMSLVIVILLIRGLITIQQRSIEGWQLAAQAYRDANEKQYIRVNTLENRLLAKNWEEFAHLQNVPDEMTKRAFLDANREMSYGETEEDRLDYEGIMSGTDLEGPTLG